MADRIRQNRFDLSLLPKRPDLSFEQPIWQAGIKHIAGIDEAGRGALAGPVAAGAVILNPDPELQQILHGVHDSKQLTLAQRQFWAGCIRFQAAAWGIGYASSSEIDALGIVPAIHLATKRALDSLFVLPEHLLLDCLLLPDYPLPQTALIKGDCRSLSIAAASILAKTERDVLMIEMEQQYPGYDFGRHKGYGTTRHLQAIERWGPSPIHRLSFKPMFYQQGK